MSLNFADYKQVSIPEGRIRNIIREKNMLVLWSEKFTNQVTKSINSDGSVYNGTGYKDGYRIRSGGTEVEQSHNACTGFIKVTPGDTIRLSGWDVPFASTGNAINCANSSFANIGQITSQPANYGIFANDSATANHKWDSIIEETPGVYKWVVPPASTGVAYIRVSGTTANYLSGIGSRMIVTVNEAIFNVYKGNLVPGSIDADGTAYNGVGYKDDVRLSSSGDVSGTAQTGSVTTGFIPCKSTDIVRIKGATWAGISASKGHYYLLFYNSSKTKLDYINSDGYATPGASVTYDAATGVTTFSFENVTGISSRNAIASAAYIRLTAKGKGEDLIVTINEQMFDIIKANLVPKAIDTDGSIFNGVGYIENYRLSSSGSLSWQANTITTGYMPFKEGNIARMTGVNWYQSGHTYIAFYDKDFTLLGSANCYSDSAAASGYYSVGRGIVRFVGRDDSITVSDSHPTEIGGVYIFDQIRFTDGSQVAYFRLNAYGSGANLIVTVNQEIT